MIHKFINQLRPDPLMLARGINAEGIQGCLFLENTKFSQIEFPHYKPHHRSIFFLRHQRRRQIFFGFKKPFKLHFILLLPGSLEYFLVNPNHSVKIVSLHESNFNGALVLGASFLFRVHSLLMDVARSYIISFLPTSQAGATSAPTAAYIFRGWISKIGFILAISGAPSVRYRSSE